MGLFTRLKTVKNNWTITTMGELNMDLYKEDHNGREQPATIPTAG